MKLKDFTQARATESSQLMAQRIEQRTHNGNPAIVKIGVPSVCNELTGRGFPSFPIISGLATQKQRKRLAAFIFASAT
jgi:hypothetical protein